MLSFQKILASKLNTMEVAPPPVVVQIVTEPQIGAHNFPVPPPPPRFVLTRALQRAVLESQRPPRKAPPTAPPPRFVLHAMDRTEIIPPAAPIPLSPWVSLGPPAGPNPWQPMLANAGRNVPTMEESPWAAALMQAPVPTPDAGGLPTWYAEARIPEPRPTGAVCPGMCSNCWVKPSDLAGDRGVDLGLARRDMEPLPYVVFTQRQSENASFFCVGHCCEQAGHPGELPWISNDPLHLCQACKFGSLEEQEQAKAWAVWEPYGDRPGFNADDGIRMTEASRVRPTTSHRSMRGYPENNTMGDHPVVGTDW